MNEFMSTWYPSPLRCLFLTLLVVSFCTQLTHADETIPCGSSDVGVLPLRGLYEPGMVSHRLMVRALISDTPATILFYIDGQLVWRTTQSPYDFGPQASGVATFPLTQFSPGPHTLTACAMAASGQQYQSAAIPFTIIPDINANFSAALSPYAADSTVLDNDIDTLLDSVGTPGAALTSNELDIRRLVFGMYLDFGIDPSLDSEHDQSDVLLARLPSGPLAPPVGPSNQPLSMAFSHDAVFYQKIPAIWPRIPLPSGYIQAVQLSTAYHGDGIGFGEVTASAFDPLLPIRSQWYDKVSTLRTFLFRMPLNWSDYLPSQAAGDRHLIAVDPLSNTFISSYKASSDPVTGGLNALFASSPHPLGTMGDSGGSNAAGFAELPLLIQPGEATDPQHEIQHALGGAVRRVWAARVYPATSRDANVLTSLDSCTGQGFMNNGLIPYGGIIQLDPNLDLSAMNLSLPAYRILRAMQVYGYYVMDFGCSDLDIYTAMDAQDLEPFGGPWGNSNGPGVQYEIQAVLAVSRLYIVPPPIKM